MKTFAQIKNSRLKLIGSDLYNDEPSSNSRFVNRQVSELEKVIYSINPNTGLPDSDISIMNDATVSPTLRQAIQNINHRVEPTAPSSYDDDVLLDSVQQPSESNSDYYDRLQQESDNYINSRQAKEE